jgi:hypothetical protein
MQMATQKRKKEEIEEIEDFFRNNLDPDNDEPIHEIKYFYPTPGSERRMIIDQATIDALIAEIQAKRKYGDMLLDEVKAMAKEIKALPYEVGDVAFHKKYGNVLIDAVEYNYLNLEKTRYIIITRSKIKKSTDEDDENCNSLKVYGKDLMPATKAAKVLYGESK